MNRFLILALLILPFSAHAGSFLFSSSDEARKAAPNPSDRETVARPPCTSCSHQRQREPYRIASPLLIKAKRADMRTPVWKTFARNFAQCAPGCQPVGTNVHRPHNGRKSCHHVDRAIDVFGMSCGGKRYMSGSRAFGRMVSCMRGKMPTIYQQAHKIRAARARGERISAGLLTDAHYDHAHFSIGCYGGFY